MKNKYSFKIADEAAMVEFGKKLARCSKPGMVWYLSGDLGAGKTTLTRGFLQGYGHTGAVKSPTYTLVEPYELENITIYHFDLYRIADPEELAFIGIDEYFTENSICLIEWPEQGRGYLPECDVDCTINKYDQGREVSLTGLTERGAELLLTGME